MAVVPFELRYRLTRRQRLVPLLRLLGVASSLYILALFTFFFVQTVVSIWTLDWPGIAVFGGLALGLFVLDGSLFFGLLDVLMAPVRNVEIRVEENVLSFKTPHERWYLFLDGLTDIKQFAGGIWTLRHWNGTVVHIPADAITEPQLGYLRNAMAQGRTPEAMQRVIQRGRRLEYLRPAIHRGLSPEGMQCIIDQERRLTERAHSEREGANKPVEGSNP